MSHLLGLTPLRTGAKRTLSSAVPGPVLVLVIVLVIVLALVLGPAVNLVSASRQLSPWKKITAGKFLITAKLVASPSELKCP